jgi:Fe-S cluster biogenesis protein NfuA
MAEVTLRQGVEVLLREHVPGLIGVADVTDHPAGQANRVKKSCRDQTGEEIVIPPRDFSANPQ